MRFRFLQWDLLGISASVLCALHCVVVPIVLSSVSVISAPFLHQPWLEAALRFCSFIFGLLAFYKGCLQPHQSKWPVLLFVTGIALLVANQMTEQHTLYLIPAASVLMISAHYLNYRRCQQACNLQKQTAR